MQLYDAKVRLGASPINEVMKYDLTAPEIILLRIIHGGDDAVLDIKIKDVSVQRSDFEERERLDMIYGPALRSFDEIKHLNGVFGVGQPLPKTLPGVAGQDPPVRRGRPPKAIEDPVTADELE